jgi:hypothetical protein
MSRRRMGKVETKMAGALPHTLSLEGLEKIYDSADW